MNHMYEATNSKIRGTNEDLDVEIVASTDGKGYWSRSAKQVVVERVGISYVSNYGGRLSGELRAWFDPSKWKTEEEGLIYTDEHWLEEFKEGLMGIGFSKSAADDVTYSEQGMQGDDYVSMDIGGKFISEFAVIRCFGNSVDEFGCVFEWK